MCLFNKVEGCEGVRERKFFLLARTRVVSPASVGKTCNKDKRPDGAKRVMLLDHRRVVERRRSRVAHHCLGIAYIFYTEKQ